MMPPFRILLNMCFALITSYAMGQASKPEQQLAKYVKQLRQEKTDSLIILKWGCYGCTLHYGDTSASVQDGQTIYVLSKKAGKFKVAVFDDIHKPDFYNADTCAVFSTIKTYENVLRSKDVFYAHERAELKRSNFVHPLPDHFSFEKLIIQAGKFTYNYTIANKTADEFGFIRENIDWFVATKLIVKQVYACAGITLE